MYFSVLFIKCVPSILPVLWGGFLAFVISNNISLYRQNQALGFILCSSQVRSVISSVRWTDTMDVFSQFSDSDCPEKSGFLKSSGLNIQKYQSNPVVFWTSLKNWAQVETHTMTTLYFLFPSPKQHMKNNSTRNEPLPVTISYHKQNAFLQCRCIWSFGGKLCVCVCSGSCFLEWFTTYVHNVVTGEYPIIRDQIFR